MKLNSVYEYHDRESKAKYVYDRYKKFLEGRILDVGADQCYLKEYLGEESKYFGIGLGKAVDININLEKLKIPFKDSSFDCVLCLDVLEHLDNIYDVFDDICRVTKKYLIISLPNPHSIFWYYLMHGDYEENQHMKFYGLPVERPDDRHKWFFSTQEAKNFIKYRAHKNNMKIIQIDLEGGCTPKTNIITRLILKFAFKKYLRLLYNKNLYSGTLWVVLKKRSLNG